MRTMHDMIKRSGLAVCMLAMGVSAAQAAPSSDSEPDWRRLRHDVDAQTRRPGGNGEFEARRQAIRERARARFNGVDTNRDGQLSRDEIGKLRPGLAQHFDRIDTNGDGQASDQELAGAMRKRQQMRREQFNQQ